MTALNSNLKLAAELGRGGEDLITSLCKRNGGLGALNASFEMETMNGEEDWSDAG